MNNVDTAMWLFLNGLTQFGYSPCILTISVKGLVPCLSSWGRHALSISLHKFEVRREIRNAEMGSSNPSCAPTVPVKVKVEYHLILTYTFPCSSYKVSKWVEMAKITPYNRQFDWQTSRSYAARTCSVYNARHL